MASVAEWLDAIKLGYGAKFSSCFDDLGVECVADIGPGIGAKEWLVLEKLLNAAGAKVVHIRLIETAVADLRGEQALVPNRPGQPAPSAGSPKKRAQTSASTVVQPKASGKQYSCFLSHHKAACAMEARFLKSEMQQMLGSEVFLDSDGALPHFAPPPPLRALSLVCVRCTTRGFPPLPTARPALKTLLHPGIAP
jgi:hypothetical protein